MGLGSITTEIAAAGEFYFAEHYHQQYLAKNPAAYCGLGGTGVSGRRRRQRLILRPRERLDAESRSSGLPHRPAILSGGKNDLLTITGARL
jgi:hypothetical protein